MIKNPITAVLAVCCLCLFAGCDPPQSPDHTVTITLADFHPAHAHIVLDVSGPAGTAATVGVLNKNNPWSRAEVQMVVFDGQGNAQAEFHAVGLGLNEEFKAGVSADNGDHISTDEGTVEQPSD